MAFVPEQALREGRCVVRVALHDAIAAAFDGRRRRGGGCRIGDQREGEDEHHRRPSYARPNELAMTEPPRPCEGRGPSPAVTRASNDRWNSAVRRWTPRAEERRGGKECVRPCR